MVATIETMDVNGWLNNTDRTLVVCSLGPAPVAPELLADTIPVVLAAPVRSGGDSTPRDRRAARRAARPAELAAEPALPANVLDSDLIRAARADDLDAFNQIVERYQRAVYNVALRIMRDPSAAEDVTQDAFIRAWRSIGSLQGEMILPWLIRIVTNRGYDVIRARNRRPADSLDAGECFESPTWAPVGAATESPAAHADRAELSGRLQDALEALNPDQRAVVVMADVQGYPYEEIAERLGIAVGTVKSRICRGRARLRALLRDERDAGDAAVAR